jgi:hypothetical protein
MLALWTLVATRSCSIAPTLHFGSVTPRGALSTPDEAVLGVHHFPEEAARGEHTRRGVLLGKCVRTNEPTAMPSKPRAFEPSAADRGMCRTLDLPNPGVHAVSRTRVFISSE